MAVRLIMLNVIFQIICLLALNLPADAKSRPAETFAGEWHKTYSLDDSCDLLLRQRGKQLNGEMTCTALNGRRTDTAIINGQVSGQVAFVKFRTSYMPSKIMATARLTLANGTLKWEQLTSTKTDAIWIIDNTEFHKVQKVSFTKSGDLPIAASELCLPGRVSNSVDKMPDQKKQWFGVYCTGDGPLLKPAQLTLDDQGCLHATPADAVFLVSGIKSLKAGPLSTAFIGDKVMDIGTAVQLSFQGKRYLLHCSGNIRSFKGGSDIQNYSLTLKEGKTSQALLWFPTPIECGDKSKLLWAGDVNGDGRLDLLLDLSHLPASGWGSQQGRFSLLLSTPTNNDELVYQAAVFSCEDP